jgi:hypothetical protein|tara:strand:+ start:4501 stop:4662 length:162 start_codon:yes stop_codon:yes gene_type:complete
MKDLDFPSGILDRTGGRKLPPPFFEEGTNCLRIYKIVLNEENPEVIRIGIGVG